MAVGGATDGGWGLTDGGWTLTSSDTTCYSWWWALPVITHR